MTYRLKMIKYRIKHRNDNQAALLAYVARAPEDMIWMAEMLEKAMREGFEV